jgi:hypothetical protein
MFAVIAATPSSGRRDSKILPFPWTKVSSSSTAALRTPPIDRRSATFQGRYEETLPAGNGSGDPGVYRANDDTPRERNTNPQEPRSLLPPNARSEMGPCVCVFVSARAIDDERGWPGAKFRPSGHRAETTSLPNSRTLCDENPAPTPSIRPTNGSFGTPLNRTSYSANADTTRGVNTMPASA